MVLGRGDAALKGRSSTVRLPSSPLFENRSASVVRRDRWFKDRGGYSCTVRGSNGPYEGDPFDFLVAYIIPEDLWYIIPAKLVVGQGSIALYPNLKNSKYEPYREAWNLLREGPEKIDRIQACVEEVVEENFLPWEMFGLGHGG